MSMNVGRRIPYYTIPSINDLFSFILLPISNSGIHVSLDLATHQFMQQSTRNIFLKTTVFSIGVN